MKPGLTATKSAGNSSLHVYNCLIDVAEDGVVFDGVILFPKLDQGWDWLKAKVKSFLSGKVDRSQNQIAGARAMLPSWIKGVKDGKTIQSITAQLYKWYKRQLDVFTNFGNEYSYHYKREDAGKNLLKVVAYEYTICI